MEGFAPYLRTRPFRLAGGLATAGEQDWGNMLLLGWGH